jgi:hypothetical protein
MTDSKPNKKRNPALWQKKMKKRIAIDRFVRAHDTKEINVYKKERKQ